MNCMAENKEWFVYGLVDPKDKQIRYVGWTVDLVARLKEHMRKAHKRRTHKNAWLLQLKNQGIQPDVTVLEQGSGDGWAFAERRWIAQLRAQGCRLTNATDGGEGTPGCHPSAETRAKIGKASRGRYFSPETRAKMGAIHRGKKKPKAWRRMMSARLKGRQFSEETKQKMSKAAKERMKRRGAAALKEMSRLGGLALAARPVSERRKHAQKIAEALKGHIVSQETKDKIGEKGKCRWAKAEYRKKMTTIVRQRWADPKYRKKMLPIVAKSLEKGRSDLAGF